MLVAGLAIVWDDVRSTTLDPKIPFQTYRPPKAPDYSQSASWLLRTQDEDEAPADVFFIAPTAYDGGRHWNAPIDDPRADRILRRVMLPNYAGPFKSVGRIFAPRYRQASLYTLLTLREDAREARQFAYGDVRAAFLRYLRDDNGGRPFFIVGVEQGGTLGLRLLAQEVAPDPAIRARLVGAYLIGTAVPAAAAPISPCATRSQSGCLAAWIGARDGDFERARRILDRALVWNARGELVNLSPAPALCFNPILGETSGRAAPARLNLGAANATGLEWGARPAFMSRQVSARCEGGVLKVSRPKSAALKTTGGWADRRKAPGFNLFYADEEADARARLAVWRTANPRPSAPSPPSSRTAPVEPAAPGPAASSAPGRGP